MSITSSTKSNTATNTTINTNVGLVDDLKDFIVNGDYSIRQLESGRKANKECQHFIEDSDVILNAIMGDLVEVKYMFGYEVYVYHDSSITRPSVYLVNPKQPLDSNSLAQLVQLYQFRLLEPAAQVKHIVQLADATRLVYSEKAAFLACLDQFLIDHSPSTSLGNIAQEHLICTIVHPDPTNEPSATNATQFSFFEGYQGIGQSGGYYWGNNLWRAKWYYKKQDTLDESWQVLFGNEIREYSYKELYAKANELHKAIYGASDHA